MQDDLAKTIAAAVLDHIQARPDSPSVDELADVVRPHLDKAVHFGAEIDDDERIAAAMDMIDKITNDHRPDATEHRRPLIGEFQWHYPDPRNALQDSNNAPSTQELYDARPSCFDDVEVPFKLLNNRRCLTEEQVIGDRDIADFVNRYRRCFKHDLDNRVYFFIEGSTPKTSEAGDGE